MKPCLLCCLLSVMITDVFGLLAIAQEEPKPDATKEVAEFLKGARANAALFRIQDAKSGRDIERIENPVLHYTQPERGDVQGTLWIWGPKGRPAAVLEMTRFGGREDLFCFHATSDDLIKLTSKTGQTWTPKSSDLKFRPLPNAPTPTDSPADRFRQMKAFARQFSSYQFWENARQEMRVLPVPLHRYEDRDRQLLDGTVFGIALGTSPGATLFLEAVQPVDEPKPIWQFAIGRSGTAEIVVLYDDKEVHHMPRIEDFPPPTNSYWRMALKIGEQGSK